MEQPRKEWSTLTDALRLPQFQGLGIDCVAVGISSIDVSAVQIQEILFLEGEIHEDPQTLQSHCASLIAIWSAVRAPTILDLGECTCVGRRILFGEPKAGRRFAVHAHPLGNCQALFAVFSSTTRWDSTELPLDRESVDRIVCNPPFGEQMLTPELVIPLYQEAAAEWDRVLRPGGRAVLLVSEFDTLREAVEKYGWECTKRMKCRILGQPAVLSVWKKPEFQ